MKNDLLLELEWCLSLGPIGTARVLGCAYSTYAQYHSGERNLPLYMKRHIEALMLLRVSDLDKIKDKYANG